MKQDTLILKDKKTHKIILYYVSKIIKNQKNKRISKELAKLLDKESKFVYNTRPRTDGRLRV
jgi:hypothetical protein